jgi:hypothetical protein
MKTIILKRILILIIPVFLFLGGYQAKADTFTWMDFNTWNEGGAGFDICNQCHFTYTFQTASSTYPANSTVNIVYFLTDPAGFISPITEANKKLAGALNYTYSNLFSFTEDFLVPDNSWIGSAPTIYVNPMGEVDFDNTDPFAGRFVLNYTGVFDPTQDVYRYPFTTFYVVDPAPSNNNPQVNVR